MTPQPISQLWIGQKGARDGSCNPNGTCNACDPGSTGIGIKSNNGKEKKRIYL